MATLDGMRWWSAGLALSVLLLVPVLAQEESEKEADMERIQGLMETGEWRAAVKALKSYKRKHAKTEEEKEEVGGLALLAEGELALEKIETDYRKKQKHRKTARELAKFLRKYSEQEELAEKAKEILQVARSQYVLIIEDFEDWESDDEDNRRNTRRFTLIDDPKLVKHGDWSCRWRAGKGWDYWSIKSPQLDWSEYDYFCMWIFNEKMEKRPGRIEIEPHSGGYHYFQYYLAIDWVGWKEIRMPLRGRASKFGRHGNPDWSSIEEIDFDHDDDIGTMVNIIVDDIHLEKHVK